MDISQNIKQIRDSKGMTQAMVAESLNMDRANYSRIEKRGDKLTIAQLKAIADVLKIPLGELLGIEQKSEGNKEYVKKLEANVERLEKVVDLYQDTVKDFESVANDYLARTFREQAISIAINEDLIPKERWKGWVELEEEAQGWSYDLDSIEAKGFNIYFDILITEIFTESELFTVITHLLNSPISEFSTHLLYTLRRHGLIKDKRLSDAFIKFEAWEMEMAGIRWDEERKVWIDLPNRQNAK